MLLKRLHLLLIHLSGLELHPGSRFLHQSLVMLYDLATATFEQADDLVNICLVFLLGNGSHATAFALSDMEVQTWAEFASEDGLRGNLQVAGSQGINAMEELHKITSMHDAAVRSEISRSVLYHLSGKKYLRKISCAHTDPRIGL